MKCKEHFKTGGSSVAIVYSQDTDPEILYQCWHLIFMKSNMKFS